MVRVAFLFECILRCKGSPGPRATPAPFALPCLGVKERRAERIFSTDCHTLHCASFLFWSYDEDTLYGMIKKVVSETLTTAPTTRIKALNERHQGQYVASRVSVGRRQCLTDGSGRRFEKFLRMCPNRSLQQGGAGRRPCTVVNIRTKTLRVPICGIKPYDTYRKSLHHPTKHPSTKNLRPSAS